MQAENILWIKDKKLCVGKIRERAAGYKKKLEIYI